jgi:hypothetical protein
MRELLGAVYGIQSMPQITRRKVVELRTDNTTAQSYINKMGGKCKALSLVAEQFWKKALAEGTEVQATYLPGVLNQRADRLSRTHLDRNDWRLSGAVFRKLQQRWGPHDVDLFASHRNNLLPRFHSWLPNPGAEAVNTLRQPWCQINGFANPPPGLIGPVLRKAMREGASLTLIAPHWPTQPWWPHLMQPAVDEIPLEPSRLSQPGDSNQSMPRAARRWKWSAFRICGGFTQRRACRTESARTW